MFKGSIVLKSENSDLYSLFSENIETYFLIKIKIKFKFLHVINKIFIALPFAFRIH